MAVYGGPKVAAPDGLVLALDTGNKKTFANSIINSTSWSLGSGSATGYTQNGAPAENERVPGPEPFGKSAVVWEPRPQGNNADDGGWNRSWYNIDSTKLHRFSVWVKRTTSTSGGTFYFGLYGNNGIRRTDNSVVEGNPYWDCRGTGGFVQDVWYLVVGHCYPYNTSYTGQHPESGIYTVAGGTTKVASINACNIGADVKWAGVDVTQAIHRCYHYYCADSTTRLQFFDPRIDVIDGTEPTIANLLSGFTANRLTDLIGTNNGSFVNGPTYSSTNGGSIVFDGTNDYTIIPENSALNTQTPTVEVWVKTNATTQNGFWFEKGTVNSQYALFQEGAVIQWRMNLDGSFNNLSTTTATYMNISNWYQVVATYTSGSRKLYINGTLVNSDAQTGTIATNANGMSIGAYGGYNGGKGYFYNGNIASVKIYNRALTAAEIQQNFNTNRGRFGI